MSSRLVRTTLLVALLSGVSSAALADPVFNRVSAFPVATNVPEGKDRDKTTTSAEIITVSKDGNTLVYSDSPMKAIGFIDISNAHEPKALGSLAMDGEPTSVAVAGGKVLVAVNTSESKAKPSGRLAVVDLARKTSETTCDLGGQPDSVAVAPDGSFAAIAIENERDEEVNEGALPQMPAGYLVVVPLKDGTADCAGLKKVDMTGLAAIAGDDPEPEFVTINEAGEIALTLQENNHIVIIDGNTAKVTSNFSAGSVDLTGVDVKTDGKLDFTGKQDARLREPDAVKWLDKDRLVVANEGDWKGGSRGFTIFSKDGKVLYENGNALEQAIARIGHYPEKRSKAKGVEPEGLEVATFGKDRFIFVLSERGSVVGVYKDTGAAPELTQLLPSGISPEGAVAIPARNLIATANEADLGEDGGARSHVMLYERAEGEAAYPTIVSKDQDGQVIGWGALGALAADAKDANRLYAASDSVYSMQPSIFKVDASKRPAVIDGVIRITREGQPAQKLDIEGLTSDGKGGFWLASEGDAAKLVPHGLYRVDEKGAIKAEVGLPAELLANETRFGFEGIARVGEGDDETLWMAVQREWKDDPKGTVKLVAYKPKSKEWSAVRYPLDKAEEGWVGLSELAVKGDHLYVLERDNQIGDKAKIKKLYRVALSELKGAKIGSDLPLVKKEEVHDFLPDLKAWNGYVVDKIEGFTFAADGKAYAVTDNDGVDDSSGETFFFPVDIKVGQ